MKLPTIATNVGGNPEIVYDNKFGRLVEPAKVELLMDAIIEMYDADKREKFKTAIENYKFSEFKDANVDTQLDQVYQILLMSKMR